MSGNGPRTASGAGTFVAGAVVSYLSVHIEQPWRCVFMPAALAPQRRTTTSPDRGRRGGDCLVPSAARHGPRTAEEAAIGLALTTSWMLITGRWMYPGPLLHDLPAEQLIDFWADDHVPGSDAAPGGPGPVGAGLRCGGGGDDPAEQAEGSQGAHALVVEGPQRGVVAGVKCHGLLPHGALGGPPAGAVAGLNVAQPGGGQSRGEVHPAQPFDQP